MKILNRTKDTVIARDVKVADSFFSRMRGLLGRSRLGPDEGLVITGCNSIHMFGMKFAIDVVFCDANDKVVGVVENIKPWRLSRIYWKAVYALEVAPGTVQSSRTQLDDKLEWDTF